MEERYIDILDMICVTKEKEKAATVIAAFLKTVGMRRLERPTPTSRT